MGPLLRSQASENGIIWNSMRLAKILLIRRRFRYSVGPGSLSEYFPWPRPRQISPKGVAEPTRLGSDPIRRRQRRMRGNLPGPEGLARRGASAALHGLSIVATMDRAALLASPRRALLTPWRPGPAADPAHGSRRIP